MPYFAIVILALFVALIIAGVIGGARHFFPGKPKPQAPTSQTPRDPAG